MSQVDRRELACVLAIVAIVIFLRSAVFIVYEQSFFNSDQAIVGLMAKHLVEGRAFPLFYYGQNYMLGVDAYIVAPVFAVFGPTVAALHAAIALANVAAASLLIVGLWRWGGLRPWAGLLATSVFVVAPPVTSASLIEAGANIGPFLYVPLLWMLRDRPLLFGPVLGLGFVHREFTIYAVPVLLAFELGERRLFQKERVRFWLLATVATLATWQVIQGLKPYADMMGPGTRGELVFGLSGSQVGNITDRVRVEWGDLPHRASVMAGFHLARLYAVIRQVDPIAQQGRDWMFWPFVVWLCAALARAAAVGVRKEHWEHAAFGWYLLGVGLLAALAAVATRPAEMVADRYILLSLFIPIGIVSVHLALERRRALKLATFALAGAWILFSTVDHVRLAARYVGGREPDEMRELVNGLLERDVRVAEAGYWRAYKVAFLSQERVKVASTDVVRIEEYQRLAGEVGARLVTIQEAPCPAGDRVSRWYLCRPGP